MTDVKGWKRGSDGAVTNVSDTELEEFRFKSGIMKRIRNLEQEVEMLKKAVKSLTK